MSHDTIRANILRLLPADGSSIGNGKMQTLLMEAGHRIGEQTYFTVRDALVAEGQIITDRGRGGSIMLATATAVPSPVPSAPPAPAKAKVAARIQSFQVNIPHIEEQKRIVALLDEAFAAIATATSNAEKKLAMLSDLRQLFLSKAFAGDLR